MAHTQHTIHIQPGAPVKVPLGAPCNGCGVCCLFAPCPLGVVLSRRRVGACNVLHWDASRMQYRCGAVVTPQDVLARALPTGARWLAPLLAPALRRLGLRWIAAGIGCDSSLEVVMPPAASPGNACVDGTSTTMPTSHLPDSSRAVVRHTPP